MMCIITDRINTDEVNTYLYYIPVHKDRVTFEYVLSFIHKHIRNQLKIKQQRNDEITVYPPQTTEHDAGGAVETQVPGWPAFLSCVFNGY